MQSTLFAQDTAEIDSAELFALQNEYMLRSRIAAGREVIARKGSMIAHQGAVTFKHEGSRSAAQMLKKMVSSDNQPLMRVSGEGDVFFAHEQAHIHLVQLTGDAITVNGANLLAFAAELQYDLKRMQGAGMLSGGMWNTTVSGTGQVAVITKGTPVLLDCSAQPTYTDMNATVAWSSTLQPTVKSSVSAGALIGRGSGEAFQYAFHGAGWVLVQPAEFSGVAPSA